jgi:hypothetical protein
MSLGEREVCDMKPITDLRKQWSEICGLLREQLSFLEEGRLIHLVAGDSKQFTDNFITRLRADIASYEALLFNFKYATLEPERASHLER